MRLAAPNSAESLRLQFPLLLCQPVEGQKKQVLRASSSTQSDSRVLVSPRSMIRWHAVLSAPRLSKRCSHGSECTAAMIIARF